LALGWNVATPKVDVGDDLFVIEDKEGYFVRIQVKTTQPIERQNSFSACFKLPLKLLTTKCYKTFCMKIEFRVVGKTNEDYLKEGISIYEKRLKHYVSFESFIIPDIKKKMSPDLLKQAEGEAILAPLEREDYLILLDENGKNYTSVEFSELIARFMNNGTKKLVFQIGGAFGFSAPVYERAQATLALSKMTFSHQMVRLFFVEQLYRAFSILRNEKYHNE
jgi:23S rRNA (pseudouridine1915-N3)-methyltransferase